MLRIPRTPLVQQALEAQATTPDGLDTSDNSSDSSSSTGSLGSSNNSDASNEVVVTKVIQGKAYEKPPDFSCSDENNDRLATVANDVQEEDKQDQDKGAFINENNAERMDRAHMLLQETGYENDLEESKANIEYDKTKTKYKSGKLRATMTKLSPKTRKENDNNKEGREAERALTSSTEGLARTINDYGINVDKGLLQTITLDPKNTLFEKYTKDRPKPKPYHKVNRWDRPLAKVPGGRSFEADVNKFLRLISKETEEDIMRPAMEHKVLEVGRPAGMLASTLEGIWARKFIADTSVSHPMDLLAKSWQEDGRMIEHNPARLFWVIAHLMGNQWTQRNPIYLPPEAVTTAPPDNSATSWAHVASSSGVAVKPRASVRLDNSALKTKLRQVKMTGAKTKHVKYYAVTLVIPKASDPAMKFSESVADQGKNFYGIDENLVIYPRQTKNHTKKKALLRGTDELPKSPGIWNSYFERMFPLKKEGSKIYTGMLIGHDEDADDLIDGITWWTMSNEHYSKHKAV
jgi:hypothetical protein